MAKSSGVTRRGSSRNPRAIGGGNLRPLPSGYDWREGQRIIKSAAANFKATGTKDEVGIAFAKELKRLGYKTGDYYIGNGLQYSSNSETFIEVSRKKDGGISVKILDKPWANEGNPYYSGKNKKRIIKI